MSIHKKDIETLLEAFSVAHLKGNMKASGELVPHLVRSLLLYVEDVADIRPKVETGVASKLTEADKAFAVAATTTSLKDNGNATVETDKGSISISVEKAAIETAAAHCLDIAQEAAAAILAEVEKEGASAITAVTTKLDGGGAGDAPKAAPKKAPAAKK